MMIVLGNDLLITRTIAPAPHRTKERLLKTEILPVEVEMTE